MQENQGPRLDTNSVALCQRIIGDCARALMDGSCNKEEAVQRLVELSGQLVEDDAIQVEHTDTVEPSCENCRKLTLDRTMLATQCSKGREKGIVCEDYDSRYMSFPMTVSGIDIEQAKDKEAGKQAELVAVRLAGETDTHLGFLLRGVGDELSVSYNRESKRLRASIYSIRPIFVPALGRVVFGYESWWKRIESETDFAEITDGDISRTWYVKAWRQMVEECNEQEDL